MSVSNDKKGLMIGRSWANQIIMWLEEHEKILDAVGVDTYEISQVIMSMKEELKTKNVNL